ncbi:MAG: hypothetical protein FWG64_02690 [Firmicutes bacterium]|nr:hypothetical protein [Bacillota bacterium]
MNQEQDDFWEDNNQPAAPQEPKEPPKKSSSGIAVGVVIAIAVIVLIIIFIPSGGESSTASNQPATQPAAQAENYEVDITGDWIDESGDIWTFFADGTFLVRDANSGAAYDMGATYIDDLDIEVYDQNSITASDFFLTRLDGDFWTDGYIDEDYSVDITGDWIDENGDIWTFFADGTFLVRDANSGAAYDMGATYIDDLEIEVYDQNSITASGFVLARLDGDFVWDDDFWADDNDDFWADDAEDDFWDDDVAEEDFWDDESEEDDFWED